MPRYFFDVFDMEGIRRDDLGVDYPSPEEARDMALIELPMIAQRYQPDGDRQTFVIQIRDEKGADIYRGTLTIVGKWLVEPTSDPPSNEMEE